MSTATPGALTEHKVGPVTAQMMSVMAEVLDDPNPIHLDPAAVLAMGMGDRLINQGPSNLGYVIDMVRHNFPDHYLTRLSARFLANVREGDEVIAGGRRNKVNDDGSIECWVWLEVSDGVRAIEGSVVLVRAER